MQENEIPIFASVLEDTFNDLGAFKTKVEERYGELQKSKSVFREFIGSNNLVHKLKGGARVPVSAVDSSTEEIAKIGLLSLWTLACRFSSLEGCSATHIIEITESNDEYYKRIKTSVRTIAECKLLADSSNLTILDGSFWSVLMNINQFLTYTRDRPKHSLPPVLSSAFNELINFSSSPFLNTITNRKNIGISKSGVSNGIFKKVFPSSRLSFNDLELCSNFLAQGEYLTPKSLSGKDSGTTGKFGIERSFSPEIVETTKRVFQEELLVTYFKPWGYKKAFRIEFSKYLIEEISLEDILFTIQQSTTDHSIIEPLEQYLADMLSKQIHSIRIPIESIIDRFHNFKIRT